jgi:putative N6-adenine-specific DNA methylase
MPKEFTVVALCAVGAEKVVSNEIRKLGLRMDEGGFGRLRFKAGAAGLYRALMGLRAADRVLLEAAWFRAGDFLEVRRASSHRNRQKSTATAVSGSPGT